MRMTFNGFLISNFDYSFFLRIVAGYFLCLYMSAYSDYTMIISVVELDIILVLLSQCSQHLFWFNIYLADFLKLIVL